MLAGHSGARALPCSRVLDAAYALLYDQALETDRLSAGAGVESRKLADFTEFFEVDDTPVVDQAQLAAFIAATNTAFGGEQ